MIDKKWIEEFRAVYKYATGSGSVATDTSMEAEFYRDYSGRTGEVQRAALMMMARKGRVGITSLELAEHLGVMDSKTSGALTNLHGVAGSLIVRLKRIRNNHHVYVLPAFQGSREEKPYAPSNVHIQTIEAEKIAVDMASYLSDRMSATQEAWRVPAKPGDKELATVLQHLAARSRLKRQHQEAARQRAIEKRKAAKA